MYNYVTIEDWDIDFDEGTAEFTIDNSAEEDSFMSVKVTLEQYPNYDNPICVIEEITECRETGQNGRDTQVFNLSDAKIDIINDILTSEYSKYLTGLK
jgi:hypothetical protein